MDMKNGRKFRAGQVVFNGTYYIRVTRAVEEIDGWYYITAWGSDKDYDYVPQEDLRALTQVEKGKNR